MTGLSSAEAGRRLTEHGRNEINRDPATPWWRILSHQFASPMIALLAAASVLTFAIGEPADGAAILTIVILNGLLGFVQEFRAERAVLSLRAMTAPRATVRRDGARQVIPAAEVVPGDVLLLEDGDLVAADARLLNATRLRVNEAALTGESVPVEKDPIGLPDDTPLAERRDRVHAGTAVVAGIGEAEVFATGMRSQLGQIAHLLATAEKQTTPLQEQLERLSRTLLGLCLAIVAVVALLGLWQGVGWLAVLLSAVSLAVAAIPEGLPAVVTIALAVGIQRMAKRNVLVRRLPSVEALGSATLICTDKTGTLTTGTMVVREIWVADRDRAAVLDAAAACCDAELTRRTGDPTELALLDAAAAIGLHRDAIEQERPRVAVAPFDATRKRMSILRADGVLYVKGAPDLLFPLCDGDPSAAVAANQVLAARGLRVLAVATRSMGVSAPPADLAASENALRLVGLIGIADPPRPEAIRAVAAARAAGIVTVMITGDHPTTAEAIAREMGIVLGDERVEDRVHARATPEDKLRIVRSWQQRGAIVAMTGDGVNDAPALREAHIGIAMGIAGTEVTREAADLVLSDDNFASIVEAVREGRGIFDNIQKTLVYLLSGNTAELAAMLGAAVIGLPTPLLPIQLLWVNLVTDGLPALALVIDPVHPDVLTRPPQPPGQPMLGRPQWATIAATGLVEASVVLGVFTWADHRFGVDRARDLMFTTLVFCELFRAFAARSRDRVLWSVGALSNVALVAVVGASVAIQVGLHHLPLARQLFGLTTLDAHDYALTLGLGLIPVTVLEISKLIRWIFRNTPSN
jgi:Ca2+-transporting ATPase